MCSILKQHHVNNWHFVWFGPSPCFWGQHHCCKYESQVCDNSSDIMSTLTTNKTHYIITGLCVECNAVILPSHYSYKVQKLVIWGQSGWDRNTIYSPVTRYHQIDFWAVISRYQSYVMLLKYFCRLLFYFSGAIKKKRSKAVLNRFKSYIVCSSTWGQQECTIVFTAWRKLDVLSRSF